MISAHKFPFFIDIPTQIGKLSGATYLDLGYSQYVAAFNEQCLYFMDIGQNLSIRYSTFAIKNINFLVSLVRGYLLVTTTDKKMWLMEIKKQDKQSEQESQMPETTKNQPRQEKGLFIQCFLKEHFYTSFFIRQVTANMVELQIYTNNPAAETKNILIYQFTINQKVGVMIYTVDKNYKIIKTSRKQLYGSKIFYDPSNNQLIKFKNFSDSQLQAKPQMPHYHFVLPICKTEQYYGISKSLELINLQTPSSKRMLKELGQQQNLAINRCINHMSYLLVQNLQAGKVILYSFEEKFKYSVVAQEEAGYIWTIGFNGRLVGVDRVGGRIKICTETKQEHLGISLMLSGNKKTLLLEENKISIDNEKIISPQKSSNERSNQNSFNKVIPMQQEQSEKKQEIQTQGQKQQKKIFKPMKIIGKSKISVSKQYNSNKQSISQKQSISDNNEESKITALAASNNKPEQGNQVGKQQQKQSKNNIIKIDKAITDEKIENEKNLNMTQQSNFQEPIDGISCKSQPATVNDESRIKETKDQNPLKETSIAAELTKNQSPFLKKPRIDDQTVKKNSIFETVSNPFAKKNTTPCPPKFSFMNSNPFFPPKFSVGKKNDQDSKAQQKQSSINNAIEVKVNIQQTIKQETIYCKEDQCEPLYSKYDKKVDQFQSKVQVLSQKFDEKLSKLPQIISAESLNSSQSTQQIVDADKINNELTRQTQIAITDFMAKKLTPRVNTYFKQVMGDTKKIYDQTFKFYTDRKKQTVISLQTHFQEQEHLINQIRDISGQLMLSVESVISQGEEAHAIMLKQWDLIAHNMDSKLQKNIEAIQNFTHHKLAPGKQGIEESLSVIKQKLESKYIKINEKSLKQFKNYQGKQQKIKKEKKKKRQKQLQNLKYAKDQKQKKKIRVNY